MEVSIMHHVCAVLSLLWLLSRFDCCYPLAYFVSFIYLYLVHERYVMRLRKLLQCEERKQANQRRVLSDSETVRWLNYAVEKMWPVCMEEIVSQKFLLPIIPWFLEKYKPWTAKEAVVQQLYMGRNPPLFTEMRVLRQTTDDDHLVLELGMNFLTADDMSAILSVKLRRRLGFGIWAKLHMTGMHVEGKVLIGVKFIRRWPFLGRVRVCFVEPPYFQMTVKPLSTHGLDVTELPGIAGWLDKLLGIAFEQTLVEPNMLVVDVEKFASPESDGWFSVDEKVPLAYAKVEVIEASEMKPSDMNGLADPYVKGQLGPYRFKTKTQWKTLTPKWHEEFKIPICTWKSQNELAIEVCDKDHFIDDQLGDCSVSISDLRDGQRHDMWLPLQKIKMGRLHLAVTVIEDNGKEVNMPYEDMLNKEYSENSFSSVASGPGSIKSLPTEKSDEVADKFEPVDIEGQDKTGIWVHQPGSSVSQAWEPRKGKNRLADNKIHSKPKPNDSGGSPTASGSFHNYDSSADEDKDGKKLLQLQSLKRGFLKFSSIFQRSPKDDDQSAREVDPTPHANIKSVNASNIGVKLIIEDSHCEPVNEVPVAEGSSSDNGSGGSESPTKRKMRDKAKSFLRHAGRSARSLKQRVLSPKASFRSDHSEITGTDREISVNSDCSDNESLRSLVHDPAASSHVNPTEPAVQTGLDLPNDPISKVCSEALEKQQNS